jgi:hypothetical protein
MAIRLATPTQHFRLWRLVLVQIKIDMLPLSSSCACLTLAAEIVTYRAAHVRSSLLQRFLFVLTLPIEQVLLCVTFCLLRVPLPVVPVSSINILLGSSLLALSLFTCCPVILFRINQHQPSHPRRPAPSRIRELHPRRWPNIKLTPILAPSGDSLSIT